MERSRNCRETSRASLEFVANARWLDAQASKECITKSYEEATFSKLGRKLAFNVLEH